MCEKCCILKNDTAKKGIDVILISRHKCMIYFYKIDRLLRDAVRKDVTELSRRLVIEKFCVLKQLLHLGIKT